MCFACASEIVVSLLYTLPHAALLTPDACIVDCFAMCSAPMMLECTSLIKVVVCHQVNILIQLFNTYIHLQV
jgi:hypothetical protein